MKQVFPSYWQMLPASALISLPAISVASSKSALQWRNLLKSPEPNQIGEIPTDRLFCPTSQFESPRLDSPLPRVWSAAVAMQSKN